jgi:hypothetical protein
VRAKTFVVPGKKCYHASSRIREVSTGSAFTFVVIDGSILAGELIAMDMSAAHAVLSARHPNADEIHIRRVQPARQKKNDVSSLAGRN